MRKINLFFFSLFLAVLISLPIFCVDRYLSHPDIPWQLVPFNADSLSQRYKENYLQLKPDALVLKLQDSSKPLVMVIIDGWGVPYDESLLKKDFDFFAPLKASFATHKRLLQHTSHAENVEYKRGFKEGILLENGDSYVCARKSREQACHFGQTLCCQDCNDLRAVDALDSLISTGSWKKIAWTAHETREGDRDKLHDLLKELVALIDRYPDVQFVIQGAHRPLLGLPEVRRKYLAPWVPVVFVNCLPKKSALIEP